MHIQAFLLFLPLMQAHKARAIQAGDGKMHVVFEDVWESGTKLHGAVFSAGIKQQKPTHVRQREHCFY